MGCKVMPFGGWESLERSSLLKVAKDVFLDTIVAVKKNCIFSLLLHNEYCTKLGNETKLVNLFVR